MPCHTLTEGRAGIERGRGQREHRRRSSEDGQMAVLDDGDATVAAHVEQLHHPHASVCRQARFNRARIVLLLPRCVERLAASSPRAGAGPPNPQRQDSARRRPPPPARRAREPDGAARGDRGTDLEGARRGAAAHRHRVRSRDAWQLFDPDVLAWQRDGPLRASFLRNLEEVRSVIEPAAASMAAGTRARLRHLGHLPGVRRYGHRRDRLESECRTVCRRRPAIPRGHRAHEPQLFPRADGASGLLGAHRRLHRHDLAARVRARGFATPSTDSRCDSKWTERRKPAARCSRS